MNSALNSTDLPSFGGTRTGLAVEEIKQSFLDNLFYGMGRVPSVATRNDLYTALALTIRDRLFRYGIHTVFHERLAEGIDTTAQSKLKTFAVVICEGGDAEIYSRKIQALA
jgi:hypothetical protein